MSLQKIRVAMETAKECQHGFSWVDEEFSELLILLAQHILGKEDLMSNSIPEGYMSLKCFEEKYKLIAAHTLARYCRENDEFRFDCAIYSMDRWWIDEEKTLEFLSKKTFFNKRIERLGRSW